MYDIEGFTREHFLKIRITFRYLISNRELFSHDRFEIADSHQLYSRDFVNFFNMPFSDLSTSDNSYPQSVASENNIWNK